MTDLRERFGALDALEVPDVMSRARTIGPKQPQLEPPPTSRRIGALVLVAAIAIAAFVLGTRVRQEPARTPASTGPIDTPDTDRVGSIGLPPEGATPSTPERGELALSFWGRSASGQVLGLPAGVNSWIYVYEDGRLIWAEESFPYGETRSITGWLERRLTPEGVERIVERVREGILWGRRFEGGLDLAAGGPIVLPPWGWALGHGQHVPTEELTHPWSRFPATAWEEPRARTYVPSTYAVCSRDPVDPAVIESLLPSAAREILPAEEWRLTPSGQHCADVTLDEARTATDALRDAGVPRRTQGLNPWAFAYEIDIPGTNELTLEFRPYLPHGITVTWQSAG